MKNIVVKYQNRATVNTGNFQNVVPGYEISAELEEGENPHTVRDKLKATVDAWLEADIDGIRAEL